MADLNPDAAEVLEIGDLYSDTNALRIAMNAIGVAIRERNRIVNDGFTSMEEIITHHSNDVKGFTDYLTNLNKTFASTANVDLRVYFSPVTIQHFTGLVHYFNLAVNAFHTIPNLMLIDTAQASVYYRHYKSFIKDKTDDTDAITVPDLNGAINWIDFRDKFLMKLSKTKGTRGTSLAYVVDNTPRHSQSINDDYEGFESLSLLDPNIFISNTMHFGEGWDDDNKSVWLLLKALLLGRAGYNHISRFDQRNNGREAWTTLKSFYEGEDFIERTRDSAFSKLTNTFYKGEAARFNFEKFIDVHKTAHKMLEDCGYNNGMGMDDATKIQHFKAGIKQDAGLEIALTQVRANPIYNTFDQLSSFLTAEVEHRSNRRKQLRNAHDRRIAALHGGGGGNGKDNKSKGGRGDKNIPSKHVDGKTVYAKKYSKEDFNNMTKSQRYAVIELNRANRKNGNGQQTRGGGNGGGNYSKQIASLQADMISMGDAIVAGVERATGEEISVVTESTNNDESTDTPPSTTPNSSTKRKATSGSVGNFIRQRRQRN